MKFTYSWLKQHLDTDASLETIADTLTRIGLEVESIDDPRVALAPFKVAHVISAEPHPDADRLRVCKVDTGAGIIQVVCGAPNAKAGMKGVFAPPGSYVPGIDLTLKPTKIRGVESAGMLCSEREMMLSDEHDGIIELASDAPIGASFAEIAGLDDPVIEIAITPNRPDALGVAGIARDLAAAGLGRVITPAIDVIEGDYPCPIAIEIDAVEACPVFAGRLIRGVRNGQSPQWLQNRLKAIGLRPISVLVDITNYITFDRARPLHVYDAAKIGAPVRVRLAQPGENVAALDGQSYETQGGECLIADENGPLGFGGVIGGSASGVSDETVDVLVEAAWFEPVGIARTGRLHGLESDARYRFERGVDPTSVRWGLDLATRMILDLAGGSPSTVVMAGHPPAAHKAVCFDPQRVASLGGLDVPRTRSREILDRLGFSWRDETDGVVIDVPEWRPDIDGEADLVEEILRIEGYDKVPSTSLPRLVDVARPTLNLAQTRAGAVKRRLAHEGLFEAVTWSFMESRIGRIFGGSDRLLLENPISSELDMMRPSILPNLMQAAAKNRDRGVEQIALFEVGPDYQGLEPKDQRLVAASLRAGQSGPRHWRTKAGPVDAYDAKADALAALEAAGAPVDNLQVFGEAPDWYHPGRSGTLRLGPKRILAAFGEVHPRILLALDLKGPMVGMEVFLDEIPQPKAKSGRARPALQRSNLPVVSRDFAFLLPREMPVANLVRAARTADKVHITGIDVFDIYEGKGIEPDQKSVAIAARLQPLEKTFTDADIEIIAGKIIMAVEKATGGILRR
ncbi:phenylalanine--tRNA ligase beta subunit [Iodidimonas nitroreducens]|uniref:Phenylalanine--tRNA ligase beta subunit n=1 Tax=Iodidimonas nitroreducens TaxID=1236968 RepID=A0A5A7N381_9PROT|nr:phenylalanine--tRNA ligase subunit beta [Iodidimonas nitroreducens]GAK32498.1 phenylalanine--tRNA ligase beta subunit [alpha proteobacterium Q-1]GER02731.1 phenylalanine--tRNA ligase beta subunit [Iodidimonas nitroreducens]